MQALRMPLPSSPPVSAAARPSSCAICTSATATIRPSAGIDFEVAPGEVFGLLGPNGAGKTTTVEILEGYRARTSGIVSVLGHDPEQRSRELRERIGIVLQSTGHVPPHHRARGDRALGPLLPAPRDVDEVIDLAGLEREGATRYARTLCGGQLRRLDFALALVGDPELIFLDEPTTGFDPAARRAAWDVVRSLQDLGKTVLLTTHYLDEAQALADRVAIVKEGRIVAEGPPAELGAGSARYRVTWRDEHGELATRETDDPTALLHQLTSAALARGEPLRDLSVTRPTLEDVYLELTAEAAQDAAGAESEEATAVTDAAVLAWHQYRLERRMFWRNPTAAFFNFFLPLLFLALFGAIFGGDQDNLDVIVPGIAGMSRHVDDVQRAGDEHHVPARAGRAQADARHAAADRLLPRGHRGQRGDQRGDPDRARRPRRARCSSASAGRRTGSSSSCSSRPASSAWPRSASRGRT